MSLDFAMRPEWVRLRERARAVAEQGATAYGKWHDSWINGYSREFSRVLAAEGWIGMTWPTEVGGGGRPGIERIIMAEEMISAGAPIAASWFADRQMGPSVYTYGTDRQKAEFLPGMLSGEATWCIGMSEPDAGSDLAAVKTAAARDGAHYIVNGQKIWTSAAAGADYCYLICRTDSSGPPHRGVSELIVPMDSPGVEVRPVRDMVGNEHFCEVFFADVRVPAENLVGAEGDAFRQTMVQLAHERGGIDRLVSNRRCTTWPWSGPTAPTGGCARRSPPSRPATGWGGSWSTGAPSARAAPTSAPAPRHSAPSTSSGVARFAAAVLGPAAVAGDLAGDAATAVCYAPAYTIQGGTSAIMRNILGERVLSLPREPR